MSIKDRILNAKRASETLVMAEWPDENGQPTTLTVHAMTARESAEWYQSRHGIDHAAEDPFVVMEKMFARCVRDEHGEPLGLTAEELGRADSFAVARVMGAVWRINSADARTETAEKK